jgi:hypothetical protein
MNGQRRAFLLLLLFVLAAPAQDSFTGVKRIVAVGDVHGGYDEFIAVLRAAGVIDASNKWSGGETHLVQTGDCLDRGAESRKVLDLLITLEGQARRAKGRVHALLGNHEAMNLYGDLRYVSAGEYEAFKTPQSAELRDRAYEELADPAKKNDAAYRSKWYEEHPLGWIEHRQAFGPSGKYGKFIRERPAIVKINDSMFLHGGISPKYTDTTIEEMNKRIRAELRDFKLLNGGLVTAEDGPLWYRGLATDSEDDLSPFVDQILKSFGVARIVIGHTPTAGAVMPRFGGRVALIDVGLSKAYNQSPACLILEEGKAFALHRGTRLELPSGTNLSGYLAAAAKLDPPGTNLRKFVESLQ